MHQLFVTPVSSQLTGLAQSLSLDPDLLEIKGSAGVGAGEVVFRGQTVAFAGQTKPMEARMMPPTRYFAFLNRTGTLVRAAVCCGTALAFLSMASAPAFATEMDDLKQQLRSLQNRLDRLEQQQAAPPVVPPKMTRSGNDKVTLTVSGQVNRLSMFADDGTLNGFFHSDNENSSTRFRFVGGAKINKEWSAGLKLEQDFGQSNNSSLVNFDADDKSTGTSIDFRQMNVFIKSKNLGKVVLGKTDTVSNNITQIDLSGTSVIEYSGLEDVGGSFKFRTEGTLGAADGPTVNGGSDALDPGVYSQFDGLSRRNVLQYHTPSMAGFTASAGSAEGDMWNVALRYKANYKQAGLKVAAGMAYWSYGKRTDAFHSGYGGSISVLHSSGANLTFSGGTTDREDPSSAGGTKDPFGIFVKPGFQFKATSLGKTAVSAHYGRTDDLQANGDEFRSFGFAVVQNIDAAALELFAFYRNYSLDRTGSDFEDINIGGIGARMKF